MVHGRGIIAANLSSSSAGSKQSGDDEYSGRNFDHRRGWIADRLELLSTIFAVDVCSYAMMSNHFHVVTHIDSERAQRSVPQRAYRAASELGGRVHRTILGGRFKSQALLDIQALAACMAYVDLNPLRAGMSDSLEGSYYRWRAVRKRSSGLPESGSTSVRPGSRTPKRSTTEAASTPPTRFAIHEPHCFAVP